MHARLGFEDLGDNLSEVVLDEECCISIFGGGGARDPSSVSPSHIRNDEDGKRLNNISWNEKKRLEKNMKYVRKKVLRSWGRWVQALGPHGVAEPGPF